MNTLRKAFDQLTYVNLPCKITLTGTTIGLLSLFAGYRGDLVLLFSLIGLTHLCDLVDGFVARKTNKASEFGVMLDSLNDAFNFCILIPALAYMLGSKTWWSIVSYALFMVCGIVRLAYYNLNTAKSEEKGYFTGMSSPIASGIVTIVGVYTLSDTIPFFSNNIDYVTAPIFIFTALMMVSSKRIKKYGLFNLSIGILALVTYFVFIYRNVILV